MKERHYNNVFYGDLVKSEFEALIGIAQLLMRRFSAIF